MNDMQVVADFTYIIRRIINCGFRSGRILHTRANDRIGTLPHKSGAVARKNPASVSGGCREYCKNEHSGRSTEEHLALRTRKNA